MNIDVERMRADGVSEKTIDALLARQQSKEKAIDSPIAANTRPSIKVPLRAPLRFREHVCGPVRKTKLGLESLFDAAEVASGLTIPHICGPSRLREVTIWRSAMARIMRDRLGMSYPQIGAALGGRDHTSIMHYHRAWWDSDGWRKVKCEAAVAAIEREMEVSL